MTYEMAHARVLVTKIWNHSLCNFLFKSLDILVTNPKKDHTPSRNSVETKQSIVVQLEVWQVVKDKVNCTQ